MIRSMTLLWMMLGIIVGITLFALKYQVQELEERLAHINREIYNNQQSIHILKAEWTYLNDPVRIGKLSEKLLAMKATKPEQLASLDQAASGETIALAFAKPKSAAKPTQIAKIAPPKPVAIQKVAMASAPAGLDSAGQGMR